MARLQAALLTDLVAVAEAVPVAEFASYEVAAALTWTRRAATTQLELAFDIVRRLPQVHHALAQGEVDLPKARVIRDAVSALETAVARQVVDAILPLASRLTSGQLRARLAKLVIEADPDAAARRHEARLVRRRVVLEPTGDSCATLLGIDLPAADATAAANRIKAISRAAKRAGDSRSLDQICADTFLALLLGEKRGLRGSVELVASLDTLTRLADHPGDLNGYGPVIAEIARQVAEQQRQSPWSFTVHDDTSGTIHTGSVRSRPGRPSRAAKPAAPARDTHPGGRAPGTSSAAAQSTGRRTTKAPPPTGSQPAAPPGSASSPQPRRPGDTGSTGSQSRSAGSAATRRHPHAALARHVRSRDRTCRAPGCRQPASRTDIDHTIAFEHGGLTVEDNLGLLCRYHHRAKHEGHWKLRQHRSGEFHWQSPLGRLYVVFPDPFLGHPPHKKRDWSADEEA